MPCIYISYYKYVYVLSAGVEVRERYFYKCFTRATIQLFAISFILAYIFSTESPMFIIGLLGFMAINAAYNSSKRGKGNTICIVDFLVLP